jgi:glutamate 5-kinase
VVIDDGAVAALKAGKSLLPAGVSSIEGSFDRGDAVVIRDASGTELGRGLSAYSHQDAQAIMGHKSREITELLGYRGRDELIHRDDMALKQGAGTGE